MRWVRVLLIQDVAYVVAFLLALSYNTKFPPTARCSSLALSARLIFFFLLLDADVLSTLRVLLGKLLLKARMIITITLPKRSDVVSSRATRYIIYLRSLLSSFGTLSWHCVASVKPSRSVT